MGRARRARGSLAALALVGLAVGAPSTAGAGDIGAFLTMPTPRDAWKTGFGFHAGIVSLPFVQGGAEFARLPAEAPGVSIETYTAQAELSPPGPKVRPFVGLGVGVHRMKKDGVSDWGTLNCLFLGVRVPLGAAGLRAEYRKVSLSGSPTPNVDRRFSLGLSLGF